MASALPRQDAAFKSLRIVAASFFLRLGVIVIVAVGELDKRDRGALFLDFFNDRQPWVRRSAVNLSLRAATRPRRLNG